MDQAFIDYLMEMGALQPQEQDIARQRAMVEQLRGNAQMPGMRQAGRVVQAANPLEFLSSVGSGYMAQQREQGADALAKDLTQKKRIGLEGYRNKVQPKQTGIVPPAGGGSPYGNDPFGVGGW